MKKYEGATDKEGRTPSIWDTFVHAAGLNGFYFLNFLHVALFMSFIFFLCVCIVQMVVSIEKQFQSQIVAHRANTNKFPICICWGNFSQYFFPPSPGGLA